MVKSTQNMKGLFSKNDQKSTSKPMKTYTFGLTPNISKYEVAGIHSLKWVKMAVCGIKCINLIADTIKILGVHFL